MPRTCYSLPVTHPLPLTPSVSMTFYLQLDLPLTFQTHTAHSLLNTVSWTPSQHFEVNMGQTGLLIPLLNLLFPRLPHFYKLPQQLPRCSSLSLSQDVFSILSPKMSLISSVATTSSLLQATVTCSLDCCRGLPCLLGIHVYAAARVSSNIYIRCSQLVA